MQFFQVQQFVLDKGFKQEPFVKLWDLCNGVCSSRWLKWPLLVCKAVSMWVFDHLEWTNLIICKDSMSDPASRCDKPHHCLKFLKYQTCQMLQKVKTSNNNKAWKNKDKQTNKNNPNQNTTFFLCFPIAFFPIPVKHFCYFCPCWAKSWRWLCWLSYWVLKSVIAIATLLLLFISKIQSLGYKHTPVCNLAGRLKLLDFKEKS